MNVLGIDISDECVSMVYYGVDDVWHYPCVICRDKVSDRWYVGEEAYNHALGGVGTLIDKLWSLSLRDGIATASGMRYTGSELLTNLIKSMILDSCEKLGSQYKEPDSYVVSIPNIDEHTCDTAIKIISGVGIDPSRIYVISRAESFIYYVMSQGREIWSNRVGLFSLSDTNMSYYELQIQRGAKNTFVYAEKQELDAGFDLSLIKTESGAKLADKLMLSSAQKILNRKLFSTVLLTGEGFASYEWARDFIKFLCNRRKVYVEADIFAKGASYRGVDLISEKPVFGFIGICDGRLDTTITINIEEDGKQVAYALANAGDRWFGTSKQFRILPDNASDLELNILPMDSKKRRVIRIPLDFIPPRHPKTRRIDIKIYFTGPKTLIIEMQDAGFGDIYPSTNSQIKQEVVLWD